MSGLLPPWPLLAAFLAVSFVLAVTPGPGVLYIVARSVAQGRRAGLASVAGVALGNLGNAIGASIGLAALMAVSPHALLVCKYVGAAYLVYLGVETWRRPIDVGDAVGSVLTARVLVDGFMVALLNPKTAFFFAAFLPQFMDTGGGPSTQSVLLGALFVGMAAATDSCYALVAGSVAPRLAAAKWRRRSRVLAAGMLVALGLITLLSGGSR